jgi:hypothetical protein
MHRSIPAILSLLLCAVRCDSNPHVKAADAFTSHYAQSRLAKWNLHAIATGTDCRVLFVETSMLLEDSLIEAVHYGIGAYAVDPGGVRRFCRERDFRGAAYKDRSARIWTFGEVTADEVATPERCR